MTDDEVQAILGRLPDLSKMNRVHQPAPEVMAAALQQRALLLRLAAHCLETALIIQRLFGLPLSETEANADHGIAARLRRQAVAADLEKDAWRKS